MRDWLIKHKQSMLILLSISCVLLVLWNVAAGKIRQEVQDTLIGQINQKINGQLAVGAVSLSLSGYIKIADVSLYDQEGSLLAQVPAIKMKYRWSDLTGGSLAMPKIETVILEQGEFWFLENNNRFNWDGLLKKEQNEATPFRSKIQLKEAKIHIQTPLVSQLLENTTGIIDWQNNPEMAISLKGKVEQSTVDINGQWGENQPGEFKIQIDTLNAVKFKELLAGTSYSLEEGTIHSLLVNVKQDMKGTLHYQAEGSFSNLRLNGKIELRDAQGNFSSDEMGLHFANLDLLISGQPAQGQGNILWNDGKGTLDFSFSLPDADPAAFMSGLTVIRPLALQVKVNGPVTEPAVQGSFSLPQISFSNMAISGVQGNFQYAGNKVALQQVTGTAYQGTLAASGNIMAEEQSYELDVSGQGLDSSRLTDKDVQGPLAFNGHVSGKGETAVTKGNFAIHNGKTYGIAFQKMTGLFVKTGTATDISGIAIQTSYGTIYPEQLSQEALERLRQQDIPVSKGELKQAVTNKLLEKILH